MEFWNVGVQVTEFWTAKETHVQTNGAVPKYPILYSHVVTLRLLLYIYRFPSQISVQVDLD